MLLLFDIGHAKVNQKSLGVEIEEYDLTIEKIKQQRALLSALN